MKKLIVMVILAMVLCFVTSCANQKNGTELYALSGENETFTINNGKIIITNEMEEFIGGDIAFKNETLLGVKAYNTRFYYYKNGEEIVISNNAVSIQGSDMGMNIQEDLGTSSSTSLFSEDNMVFIQESLNFKLTGTFISGEAFEYQTPIEVTKVN